MHAKKEEKEASTSLCPDILEPSPSGRGCAFPPPPPRCASTSYCFYSALLGSLISGISYLFRTELPSRGPSGRCRPGWLNQFCFAWSGFQLHRWHEHTCADGRDIREGQAGVESETLGLKNRIVSKAPRPLRVPIVPTRDLVLATSPLFSLSLATDRQGSYPCPCGSFTHTHTHTAARKHTLRRVCPATQMWNWGLKFKSKLLNKM